MRSLFSYNVCRLAVLGGALLLTSALNASTIEVLFHGTMYASPIQRSLNNGSTWTNANVGVLHFERTGGTETDAPHVGAHFYGFCIEPLETVIAGSTYAYEWSTLEISPTNVSGGMGAIKADQLRQLYQRFFPVFDISLLDAVTSRALQIATWEIIREASTENYDVSTGVTRFRATSGSTAQKNAATVAMIRAQSYLDALVNPSEYTEKPYWHAMRLSGVQDVAVQYYTPEPMSFLLVGLGLTCLTLRRSFSGLRLPGKRVCQ